MNTPDLINGFFETSGSVFVLMSIWKLHKEKTVRGAHWATILFFTSWGFWNIYYYPHLEQWASFAGGLLLAFCNAVLLSQMLYYNYKEKKNKDANLQVQV